MYDRETRDAFWGIIQHNYEELTPEADWNRRMGDAYFDRRISGAAILFTLPDISPDIHEQAMEDLATAAEEHDLDADDVRALLEKHEKTLKKRIEQPIMLSDADFED